MHRILGNTKVFRSIISLLLCALLIANLGPFAVFADDYAIFGGIMDAQTLKSGVFYYQEVTFMSGKPVVLTGTVTIPVVPVKDTYTLAIKYALANTAEKAKLDRTVTYNITKAKNLSMSQVILDQTIPVGNLKETVVIGSNTYNLTSYQFSRSVVQDQYAGIRFDSGNVYYKKVFHVNGDETTAANKVTLIGESKQDIGFESYWSSLATKLIHQTIAYESTDPANKASNWDGKAALKFSTKVVSDLNYVVNDVQSISFRGGLLKTTNREVVMQYTYEMPPAVKTAGAKPLTGEKTLNAFVFNASTRLPVPVYSDLGGHWAEESCFRMGSLEAFDTAAFFFPDAYVTRDQFARALINTIMYIKPETPEQIKAAKVILDRPNATPLPFTDIRRDSPYYIYIEKAVAENLMFGEGNGQFLPTRPLHREEAITVMVRALGIQKLAPALPYTTGYKDDAQIANWAKNALYMSKETGLVKGYPDGTIRPKDLMTRAQAAEMLSRFIDHLRKSITQDYREKLLNQY